MWHPDTYTYELWDWVHAADYHTAHEASPPHGSCTVPVSTSTHGYSGDTLSLVASYTVPARTVFAMAFMATPARTLLVSVCCDEGSTEPYIEARADSHARFFVLPPPLHGQPLAVKALADFLVVGSAEGYLYVVRADPDAWLVEANADGLLLALVRHSTRPLVEKEGLQGVPASAVCLKAATHDAAAIFDIVGTWLVYCPKMAEIDYYKNLLHCTEAPGASQQPARSVLTPVKLPPHGPLLLRVLSSVSNTTIDKLFSLSQFSTKKVKAYMATGSTLMEKDISLQSISASISKALYLTTSRLKKHALLYGEHEMVKIVDLRSGQVMATFKPPGGVSRVSLSHYDLQLALVSYRGDHIYMWDLFQLPRQVSLVGKFVRGKTSAVIHDIFWLLSNRTVDGAQVTNSGFGCISKNTGTVHWYNINYLSCGHKNENLPNVSGGGSLRTIQKRDFLDSWLLPGLHARKFVRLPRCLNVSDMDTKAFEHLNLEGRLYDVDQLAVIDGKHNLRLVSPLTGKHTFKYKLGEPRAVFDTPLVSHRVSSWCPEHRVRPPQSVGKEMPLSQTEVETCTQHLSMRQARDVKISVYDLPEDAPEAFWDHFATYRREVPVMQTASTALWAETARTDSAEDLLGDLDGLALDPQTSPGCDGATLP